MPRWMSRITPEITNVQCEQLRYIRRDDAFAEGVEAVDPYAISPELPPGMPACFRDYQDAGNCFSADPIRSFRSLWESINGEGSWVANPWVWVVEFKQV